MLFWYMLFVLPVVCRLLRRCWLPSRKNFAALKKFGVCDNKHFDFDFDFAIAYACAVARNVLSLCASWWLSYKEEAFGMRVITVRIMVAIHSIRIGDVVLMLMADVATLFLKHTSRKQTAVCTVLQN